MKKILIIVAVGVFLAMTASSVYAGVEVFQTKTGVIQYNPTKAYNGYTLFTPWEAPLSYLIDMDGNVVHVFPNKLSVLLENGNAFGTVPDGGLVKAFIEVDWDGNYVWGPWEKPSDRPDIWKMHHASCKMFNPQLNKYTYLVLALYANTNEEIWNAGGDPGID